MPTEFRFDELDLREEPALPGSSGKEQTTQTCSCGHACPTTTVQHTFDCLV